METGVAGAGVVGAGAGAGAGVVGAAPGAGAGEGLVGGASGAGAGVRERLYGGSLKILGLGLVAPVGCCAPAG